MCSHRDLDRTELLHGDLTRRILITFFEVYNELGSGFLESVYRVAFARALRDEGLNVEQEWPIDVFFRHVIVGRFHADLVVNNCVVVELKTVRTLLPEHHAQLIHYLRATTFEVGLLLNFGRSPEYKRLVYSNKNKGSTRVNPRQID
jgi:GxxExxY protein